MYDCALQEGRRGFGKRCLLHLRAFTAPPFLTLISHPPPRTTIPAFPLPPCLGSKKPDGHSPSLFTQEVLLLFSFQEWSPLCESNLRMICYGGCCFSFWLPGGSVSKNFFPSTFPPLLGKPAGIFRTLVVSFSFFFFLTFFTLGLRHLFSRNSWTTPSRLGDGFASPFLR